MIDMLNYNSSAIIKAFDRADCGEIGKIKPVILKTAWCSVKQKAFPISKFRFIGLVNRAALKATGFFIAELQSLLSAMSLAAWKKRAWATLTSQPRRIADARETINRHVGLH